MQVNWNNAAGYGLPNSSIGDAPLSLFLLKQLFPKLKEAASNAAQTIIYGTGSYLDRFGYGAAFPFTVPRPSINPTPAIIFGGGYEPENIVPGIPVAFPAGTIVAALRGGKSLNRCLERQPGVALGDPACLLPDLISRDMEPSKGTVAIVRFSDELKANIDSFSTYVAEPKNVIDWLRRLWRYRRIITGSLHAAIIADSYGIEWKATVWDDRFIDHFGELGIYQKPAGFAISDREKLHAMRNSLMAARDKVQNYLDTEGRVYGW